MTLLQDIIFPKKNLLCRKIKSRAYNTRKRVECKEKISVRQEYFIIFSKPYHTVLL